MSKYSSKGFTLAEVLITLTIIGIITAVIIPVAIHSKPNENVMKFKKAHNTLFQVISIMINSDKYYLDGDLGIRADGKIIAGNSLDNGYSKTAFYFCSTFADLVSGKNKCGEIVFNSCAVEYGFAIGMGALGDGKQTTTLSASEKIHQWDTVKTTVTKENTDETKALLDKACKEHTEEKEEIKTADGVVYYEIASSYAKFGSFCPGLAPENGGVPNQYRCFGKTSMQKRYRYEDQNGMDNAYKTFCIDVDGMPSKGSNDCDDVKDICPFGYGIRADGKILTGKRADEWLEKSLQGEN